MNRNKLALALAIIAGCLCIGNFIYKLINFNSADYMILFAGIFIIGLGVATFFTKWR
jgi:hypothetical protein